MTLSDIITNIVFVAMGIFYGFYPIGYIIRVSFLLILYRKHCDKVKYRETFIRKRKFMAISATLLAVIFIPVILLICIYLEYRYMLVAGLLLGLAIRATLLKHDRADFLKIIERQRN